MDRKILLLEPNYKNKYPPMGLMKISTYHKILGDSVTFYKGNLKDFVLNNIVNECLEKLYNNNQNVEWARYKDKIIIYIKRGLKKELDYLFYLSNDSIVKENLIYYRKYFKGKKYLKNQKWDRIYITTLFTFYFKQTIETINFAKILCSNINEIKVGGVAASVIPEKIEKETGIKPWVGLLDKPGVFDNNDLIIDKLPLDYSILEEIEYKYPVNNAYYTHTTRGCVNKCSFCAVPKIEPKYNKFISIKNQIEYIRNMFGEKRNLLLLDNNVLASPCFNKIIDEIKECGFDKNAKYIASNQYNIAIERLNDGYNDDGYINCILSQYKKLMDKLDNKKAEYLYKMLKEKKLLYKFTATKDAINILDKYVRPLFKDFYSNKPKIRYVDFNQGIDARLLTEEKMRKLSEIPIRPLRIAFDNWEIKNIYIKSVKIAAKNGIKNMSNYLLYNYKDKPIDLYNRLKINIDLCEELNIRIYSFPMKYHPIKEPKYFSNRNYIGTYWNKKYIRAIQAILNSTKGKVGRGRSFFEEAFGANKIEFEKLLYMPEALIIYRMFYKNNGTTYAWYKQFKNLNKEDLSIAKDVIHKNNFKNIEQYNFNKNIKELLYFYTITKHKKRDAFYNNFVNNHL